MASFSRWNYGNIYAGVHNGHYSDSVLLLGYSAVPPTSPLAYVGLGNSVYVQVELYTVAAPVNATDIMAIDIMLLYSDGAVAANNYATYRSQNTGSSTFVSTTSPNIIPRPHELVSGVSVGHYGYNLHRIYNPRYNPFPNSNIYLSSCPIIRDIAANDCLSVLGYIVPMGFTSTTTSDWVMAAQDRIKVRMCYGGNARSH